MTRLRSAATVIWVGLLCIALGSIVGFHRVSAAVTPLSPGLVLSLPDQATSCGSVFIPQDRATTFTDFATRPVAPRFYSRFHIQSCPDATHSSFEATAGLLITGAVLAGVGLVLRRRERQESGRGSPALA